MSLFSGEATLPPATTLAAAIEFVKRNMLDGVDCPCCGQFARVYKRRLSATMAAGLIELCTAFERTGDWIYIPDVLSRSIIASGGYFSLVAHWRLATNKPSTDSSKRTSGFWKPTDLGVAFVNGTARVPAFAMLYDNRVLEWAAETTDIRGALGKRFDYAELMSRGHP